MDMFFSVTLREKKYRIKPWTTRKEMAYHLYSDESTSVDDLFELLVDITPKEKFSEQDKIFFLYMTLINSNGGDIQITYTCDNCKQVNDTSFSLSDFLKYDSEIQTVDVNGDILHISGEQISIETSKGLEEVNESYLDNLDLSDAQFIHNITKKSKVTIEPTHKCISCGNKIHFDNTDMYKKDLIRSDLGNLYQLAHDFQYYGNIDINVYYDMIPFEREIYLGLIEARKEEEKKQQ